MSLQDIIHRAKSNPLSLPLRSTLRRGALLFALPLLALALKAQSTTQNAGQSSSSTGGSTVTAGQSKSVLATPAPTDATKSVHLKTTSGPPPEDLNRKALEDGAGKDAGKLLVRSTPTHARIYINGAFVGYAPQLFVVAPGKYKIELRGQRDNYAEKTLGLLPNDTQNVSLDLTARYPFHVSGAN
jgi:PEGA domain